MTLLGKSLIVSHRQLNICKAFILRPCFGQKRFVRVTYYKCLVVSHLTRQCSSLLQSAQNHFLNRAEEYTWRSYWDRFNSLLRL